MRRMEHRSADLARSAEAARSRLGTARLLTWGLILFVTGAAMVGADVGQGFRLILPTLVGMWALGLGFGALACAAARLVGERM
mgnify:CR=1 FL=1